MASYSRVYIQSRRRRRSHKGLHLKHVSRCHIRRIDTHAHNGVGENRGDALCSTLADPYMHLCMVSATYQLYRRATTLTSDPNR